MSHFSERAPATESPLRDGKRKVGSFSEKYLGRVLGTIAVGILVLIAVTVIAAYPRIRNMKSEYATADAIRDIEEYVRDHDGQWPGSPVELGNHYPIGGGVTVDYTMTAARLIEHPGSLRDAVRPESGRFYTYPRYLEDLEVLHAVIREAHGRGRLGADAE